MGKRGILDPALRKHKREVLEPTLRRYRRSELNRPVFEWGGVFEKWSRGFVKRNFWRVAALFLSEEDALQECAAIFTHCRNRYAGKLDEPKHLMALYQTALNRAWNTFSSKDPHFRCIFVEHEQIPIEEPAELAWDGKLAALVSQVDGELKQAIVAIINAPEEFLSIIFDGNDTQRSTRRLSRMFGIKSGDRDLVVELRELLAESI